MNIAITSFLKEGQQPFAKALLARYNRSMHRILSLFILLVISAPPLWALVLIDVRPYRFGPSGKKGIRIVYVDRDHQRIQRLVYVANTNGHAKVRLQEGITIQNGCRVCLGSGITSDQYMVRSSGPIEGGTIIQPNPAHAGQTFFYWGRPTELITPQRLIEILRPFRKAPRVSDKKGIKALFISEDGKSTVLKPLTSLHETRILNTQEMGRLGEIITDLIFFSYGYQSIPSKFEHNHGFDGLYTNKLQEVLIITESKFRPSESKSPSKYMKECLSECALHDMVVKIRMKHIDLPLFHQVFSKLLAAGGKTIYKVVQRMTLTGCIETLIAPFSLSEWNKCSVSSLAQMTLSQKIIATQEFIDRLGLDRYQKQQLLHRLLGQY